MMSVLPLFYKLEDAKQKIPALQEEYNGFGPHSAWSGLTPNEVVQQHSNGQFLLL
jgi:hypothetical protein